jgi:Uma2 family endonuclease
LLQGEAITRLTDAEFFDFCQANPLLHFERNANHEIIIMPPAYPDSSEDGLEIGYQLQHWNRTQAPAPGHSYESSAGFKLPNGAVRAPDVAWLNRAARAVAEQAGGFLAACPEFVVEIRSLSDRLATLQAKMLEYLGRAAGLTTRCRGRNGLPLPPRPARRNRAGLRPGVERRADIAGLPAGFAAVAPRTKN